MNELLFFFHIFLVVGFALISLRLGQVALIAFITLQGVLANLFVVKQMELFGFAITCSDVFAVGGILSLNLLQEYFGREAANYATRLSLGALLFFAIMSQIQLLYIPTEMDGTQIAFETVLSSAFRIAAASLATFYLVQQVDVRLFGLLKGSLPVRIATSLVCSQALDTVLFSFLGLYGLVESVWSIILLSFLIKCVVISVSAPFVIFAKRMVKHVPV